jgi:hypothetical protein
VIDAIAGMLLGALGGRIGRSLFVRHVGERETSAEGPE